MSKLKKATAANSPKPRRAYSESVSPPTPRIHLAAKEIFELHNDKGREENDHASQHNRSFSKTEKLGNERFVLADQFFILALRRGVKKDSSQDVCNEENITKTEDVFGKCIQIEKQLQELVKLITEDRVRRSQQGRKDRKDRNCNHNAAEEGPKIDSSRIFRFPLARA